ncbi:SERTA domain-containing protein [Camponotus japonicus]
MRLEEDLVIRRSRPTMISAKYRAREERRRLMKISAVKLKRIEDPEASLCRSVLINNALRRLHRESRDDKTRSYGTLPVMTSYMDDVSKESSVTLTGNLISDDEEASSRKRLADDSRNDGLGSKRQRHDDLDLQDDVFSDFYILPPTPRLLSHIDELQPEPEASHHNSHHHLGFPEDRLSSGGVLDVRSNSASSISATTASSNTSCHSVLFPEDLDDANAHLSRSCSDMMEVADVVDPDRLCDFARFADSAKTLEERLAELQSLDEHFDLTKFERNNNQSCGRAFHDIQTFHSLVPGLET